jgi:hypothetical protein
MPESADTKFPGAHLQVDFNDSENEAAERRAL